MGFEIKKYKCIYSHEVETKNEYGQNGSFDVSGIYINKDGVTFQYNYGVLKYSDGRGSRSYTMIIAIIEGYKYRVDFDYIFTKSAIKYKCKKLYKQVINEKKAL